MSGWVNVRVLFFLWGLRLLIVSCFVCSIVALKELQHYPRHEDLLMIQNEC